MGERGYCPGPRSKGWRVDREEDGLVGVQASSLKDSVTEGAGKRGESGWGSRVG